MTNFHSTVRLSYEYFSCCCQGQQCRYQLKNIVNEKQYTFIDLRNSLLLNLKNLFIIFIDETLYVKINIIY